MILFVLSGLCTIAVVALIVISVVGAGGSRDAAMEARMARRQERIDDDVDDEEATGGEPATERFEAPTPLPPRRGARSARRADDAAA